MEAAFVALCMLVVAIAGFVQGTTGFGSGLVIVPLLSIFLLPREVAPIALVLGTVINLGILSFSFRHVRLRLIAPIFAASVVGIPIGTALLIFVPSDAIRILISLVVIPFATIMYFGWRFKVENEKVASIPAGFLSGLLNGSVTMSGPPLVILFQNQGLDKETFRACIVSLFLANNVVTFFTFYVGGLFTTEGLGIAALLLPSVVLGLTGGIMLSRWLPEKMFKKVALLLLIAAGISSLISGIIGLAG